MQRNRKNRKNRKLSLRKETVRTLSSNELSKANGGFKLIAGGEVDGNTNDCGGWDFTTTTCLGQTRLKGG
jgi:hypothetical protein